jgi:hypothetical protein
MKATGAEIMAFYAAWPVGGDFYHDDGYETDNDGNLSLDPAEEYDVGEAIGYLAWQGDGKQPKSIEINGVKVRIPSDWTGPSAEDVFKAWRGDKRAHVVMLVFKAWRGDKRAHVVMLEPAQVAEFKAVCAERGWETA